MKIWGGEEAGEELRRREKAGEKLGKSEEAHMELGRRKTSEELRDEE